MPLQRGWGGSRSQRLYGFINKKGDVVIGYQFDALSGDREV